MALTREEIQAIVYCNTPRGCVAECKGALESGFCEQITGMPDVERTLAVLALSQMDRISALETKNAQMREVLERLARLGNGDQYGNSDGNMIARAALRLSDV